jgi:hypothetical protein
VRLERSFGISAKACLARFVSAVNNPTLDAVRLRAVKPVKEAIERVPGSVSMGAYEGFVSIRRRFADYPG